MQQFGAEAAFKRQLLFSEADVLNEILGYLKKSLGLVDAEVLTVEEALVRSEAGSQGYNKMIVQSQAPLRSSLGTYDMSESWHVFRAVKRNTRILARSLSKSRFNMINPQPTHFGRTQPPPLRPPRP